MLVQLIVPTGYGLSHTQSRFELFDIPPLDSRFPPGLRIDTLSAHFHTPRTRRLSPITLELPRPARNTSQWFKPLSIDAVRSKRVLPGARYGLGAHGLLLRFRGGGARDQPAWRADGAG